MSWYRHPYYQCIPIALTVLISWRQRVRTSSIRCVIFTPALPPCKLQRLLLGKVLFDGVMNPLDNHVLESRPLQNVGHGGRVAKGIHRPATAGSHAWTHGHMDTQYSEKKLIKSKHSKNRQGEANLGGAASTDDPQSADPAEQSSGSSPHQASPSPPSRSPVAPPSAT